MAASVSVSGGKSWRKKLEKIVAEATSRRTDIGIFGSKDPETGDNLAERLERHEFGTVNTPSRAPLRSCLAENKGKWAKGLKDLLAQGMGIEDALNIIGEIAANDAQQRIDNGLLTPRLKDATVMQKIKDGYGASAANPVQRTGATMRSIMHRIAVRGEDGN